MLISGTMSHVALLVDSVPFSGKNYASASCQKLLAESPSVGRTGEKPSSQYLRNVDTVKHPCLVLAKTTQPECGREQGASLGVPTLPSCRHGVAASLATGLRAVDGFPQLKHEAKPVTHELDSRKQLG